MTGRRLGINAGVLVALVAAAAVRASAGGSGTAPGATTAGRPATTAPGTGLVAERRAAALAPCPTGISRDLPDIVLPCLGGGPDVRLRGPVPATPALVNVYGSWCGPCQEEMPVLVAFARLAGDRVRLVGIDDEDDPRQALLFAHDLGQHWAAVRDDDKQVLPHYGGAPPVTLFLDATGHVVHVRRGPFRHLDELRAAVARYLGVRV